MMSPSGNEITRASVQLSTDDQLSRRSACDRCRAHKLRCLRDETTTDVLQPCRRCSKAGVTCSTGISLRSGRPSKSGREKQASTGGLRIVGHLQPADPSHQPQSTLSSGSSHSQDMAIGASPSWLADWENMLQPGIQSSSATSNLSPQDHSGSGTTSSQDCTFVNPLYVSRAIQDSNIHGTNALDFESLLNMAQMNHLGFSQDDVMDLEVDGYRISQVPNSGPQRNARDETPTSIPHQDGSAALGARDDAEVLEPFLELIDLKEEVLRRLAELHSGLLADLNLIRSVGKGHCRATSRVALASSQRNADGKTEEYNFLLGRMLSRAEIFFSVLRYFTPSPPVQSNSEPRESQSESEDSGEGQDIMNEFTSWNNITPPTAPHQKSSQSGAIPSNPSGGILRCDVPMTLSILTCYVCLIRIYRTIFSNTYTSLIAAREGKLELPPLFPGLKLGGFQPALNLQVQILLQLSTNLLNKIDEALGLPDENGRAKMGGGILDQTGSASLLQTMMKEEAVEELSNGDPSKASLREIMRNIGGLC